MKTLSASPARAIGLMALGGLLAFTLAIAQACTREYMPVCGQVMGEQAPKTFANRCVLDSAQATWLARGECQHSTKTANPADQNITGHDIDVHGCKGSAGYQWNAELNSCVRPWMSTAVTLEVASKARTCTSAPQTTCLMVRELVHGHRPQKWAPLRGEIAGFKHVPGQLYKLRVRKDKLENSSAAGPNTRYTLLKVLP